MSDGPVSTSVDLDETWRVLAHVHGGYLLATMVETALRQADPARHPHPVATAATYSRPARPGPATVDTYLLKTGRTVATYRVVARQNGQDCAQAFVTAGRLPEPGEQPHWISPLASPPPIPPVADCVPLASPHGTIPGVSTHVEQRLAPETATWTTTSGAGEADIRGWARMIDNWDPVLAQFILADAPPPVTFDLGITGWVPTLSLHVLLRQVPMPGWHRFRHHALLLSGGMLDEDCALWAEDGSIVTQARQLATYRT